MERDQKGHVRSETHKGITTIEFFHPQSNSLPRKILDQLADEIQAAGLDPDTLVIILRSAGEKAFCAGASFEELAAIKDEKSGFEFFSGFAAVINAMRKCPKLIIARIHGKCIGGGVGLAAAADYAIAAEGAEVRLSELAIGIGPFVVGPAIELLLQQPGRYSGLAAIVHNHRHIPAGIEVYAFQCSYQSLKVVVAGKQDEKLRVRRESHGPALIACPEFFNCGLCISAAHQAPADLRPFAQQLVPVFGSFPQYFF